MRDSRNTSIWKTNVHQRTHALEEEWIFLLEPAANHQAIFYYFNLLGNTRWVISFILARCMGTGSHHSLIHATTGTIEPTISLRDTRPILETLIPEPRTQSAQIFLQQQQSTQPSQGAIIKDMIRWRLSHPRNNKSD
jgi:hypothetical protein